MSFPSDKHIPDIPEDYFGKFSDKLKDRLVEEEVFAEDQYPTLFGSKKEEGFGVPADYFNDFMITPTKNNVVFNTKKILLGLAASVLIAVSIFALSGNNKTVKNSEINSDEILQYFAEDSDVLYDLNDDDLEILLSAESENTFTSIDEEILIDYLIEDADQIDLAWLY